MDIQKKKKIKHTAHRATKCPSFHFQKSMLEVQNNKWQNFQKIYIYITQNMKCLNLSL